MSEDADADGSAKRRRENDAAKESIQVRCNSHVLVVGDPGLGKSQMLRAAAAVAPRAVYVCGNTTTTTGLTVSLTREGKSGAPALEAGAVVLGDRGACCIDEFDKMDSGQHAGLLEAMEQQQISIAKAGVVATLQARTAILAAANPAGGSYDRARARSRRTCGHRPPLARFDLVFLLVGRPGRRAEMNYCRGCVGRAPGVKNAGPRPFSNAEGRRAARRGRACPRPMPRPSKRNCEKVRTPWMKSCLRASCGRAAPYVRRRCHPRLDTKAAVLLQKTYLELRREASLAAPGRAMPITTRQLESLVRLAQARAKIENRSVVTEDDARDVVALMKDSVREPAREQTGMWTFQGRRRACPPQKP